MHRFIRVTALVATLAVMVGFLLTSTSAHEHREIANGQYTVNIGFIHEPAFVNQQNGLYLRVEKAGTPEATDASAAATPNADDHAPGNGVVGLQETLQAEVIYGDQSMPLPLTPGTELGVYESVFFPTAVGDYTFHIFGEIEGTAIDETFRSSPEGFDSVQAIEDFQFPKP